MLKFKLTFKTNCDGLKITADKDYIYDGKVERVIVVDDLETAQAAAKAMLGEEVALREKLKKLISVKPTEEKPGLYVYDGGERCWRNVLRKLHIHPENVEYIRTEVEGMQEIVGFRKLN